MKKAFLAWLLVIICSKAFSHSACGSTLAPKAEGDKPLVLNKQHGDVCDIAVESNSGGKRRAKEGMHEVLHLNSLKKGKAVYGGQDVIRNPHPAPPRVSAASLLVTPSSLLSAAFRHVAVGLLIFVFFF
ncbi:hypothetical protein L1049_023031 [Liquidambar formosana]|uniref:Uncharacterized protein n=1 Tax=Liquidambar formosana TaxID=63359 RepID=A0AAP0REV4_LIQFO